MSSLIDRMNSIIEGGRPLGTGQNFNRILSQADKCRFNFHSLDNKRNLHRWWKVLSNAGVDNSEAAAIMFASRHTNGSPLMNRGVFAQYFGKYLMSAGGGNRGSNILPILEKMPLDELKSCASAFMAYVKPSTLEGYMKYLPKDWSAKHFQMSVNDD